MLKNEKSANRNDHQNRKTEVFCNKKQKTDLKNSQNRKTENPNAPPPVLFSPQQSSTIVALVKATKHKANPATDEVRVESRNHGLT